MREKQLQGLDFKTRLTVEHMRANWLMSIGDVHPQPMDWDAPLAYGFKSRLAMLSYMMIIRL
eukprot:6954400-Alexandrium_andersonii.AAC.1